MNKLLKVKCPQCHKVFSYYESEFRPFCSERCKMIDLGHWFEESYKVPAKELVPDEKNKKENNNEKPESNEEVGKENISEDQSDEYDNFTQVDEDQYDENDY